jgi:TRAP-type C4-dicarboxylate transport system substrate-binding protein
MKKGNVVILIFCVFLIMVVTILSFVSDSSAKPINISFATFRPPTDVFAKPWLIAMGKELEEKTNGRVKFTVHWASSLGKGRDQFYMVRDGVADMTDFPGAWIPGKFTLSEVGSLPLAAENSENVVKAMNMLRKKGYFDTQWGEVEVLGMLATSPYDLFFRKAKPMTLEDMAGLRCRTPGGYISEYLKALSMVPVKVLPSDAYMSWETGVVDAWVHPPTAMIKYKFIELPTRCLLDANLQILGNAAKIMNKKKMASLPPDIQQIVREVAAKYCEVYTRLGNSEDVKSLEKIKKAGIKVYKLPAPEMEKMKAAGLPIWEKYIAEMEAKGLPGKEIVTEYVKALRQLGENPPYKP